MKIRDYEESDFEMVKNILEETGLFIPEVDTKERYQIKSEAETGTILVAEKQGEVVGTASITDDGNNVLITRMAVSPEHQGEGVGSDLLTAAEDWLDDRGTEISVAFVEAGDRELQDWYEKRGYKSKGKYKMMWKDL